MDGPHQRNCYLKGGALQEWSEADNAAAINALCSRLDPGSNTIAVQDLCHSLQKSSECLRLHPKIAYGKDNLNHATRDTLLYSHLYEGLTYDFMQSPAVSGAQS